MRKALGAVCYLVMLAADGFAGYFTYLSYNMKMPYDVALMIFTPLFIVSYWFSTFFSQLIHPRGSKPLINKYLYSALYWLSTLLSRALLGAWIYLFIDRALYRTIGVEKSGELKPKA